MSKIVKITKKFKDFIKNVILNKKYEEFLFKTSMLQAK